MSLDSDMSNSGDKNSLGSQVSGSWGSFLRIYIWVVLVCLGCCCFGGIGALLVLYLQKKQSKSISRKRPARPEPEYDPEEDEQDYQQEEPMLEQRDMQLEQPPYEPNQTYPPVDTMPEAMDQSYYTQPPAYGSNYMQQYQPGM
jgi:hypothetical protein